MSRLPTPKPKKKKPSKMDRDTVQRKSTVNKNRAVSATDIKEATTANQFDALQRRIDAMPDGNIKKSMQRMLTAQVNAFERKQARDADMATVRQQNAARSNKMKGKVTMPESFDEFKRRKYEENAEMEFEAARDEGAGRVRKAKGGVMGFNAGGMPSRKGSYDYRKGGMFK